MDGLGRQNGGHSGPLAQLPPGVGTLGCHLPRTWWQRGAVQGYEPQSLPLDIVPCAAGGAVLLGEMLLNEARDGPVPTTLQVSSRALCGMRALLEKGSRELGREAQHARARGCRSTRRSGPHSGEAAPARNGTLARPPARAQSLNMLVQTHGKERTASEYKALLESRGFVGVVPKVTGVYLDAVLAFKPS